MGVVTIRVEREYRLEAPDGRAVTAAMELANRIDLAAGLAPSRHASEVRRGEAGKVLWLEEGE